MLVVELKRKLKNTRNRNWNGKICKNWNETETEKTVKNETETEKYFTTEITLESEKGDAIL